MTLRWLITACFASCFSWKGKKKKEKKKKYEGKINKKIAPYPLQLPMTSFTVSSTIISRYASTRVRCAMHNPHPTPRQAAFDLHLSPAAFITNFTITVAGKVYAAEVMEKHRAKELYEAARKQGKTEPQRFRVTATVASNGDISFELCYEELLQRRLGAYRYAVAIHPRQIVAELRVELSITERAGISDLRVLPFHPADTQQGMAMMVTTPSIEVTQAAFSATGLAGDFVVEYDVARRDAVGDVELQDGYFVHFFAPSGLPPIPKDIIFLIDVSGSMAGTKIKQTKVAMQSILRALRPHDRFNLVAFADAPHVWREDGPIPATTSQIRSAARYIESLEAEGTDLDRALLAAAALLRHHGVTKEPRVPLLLLLTDGEPTMGVTQAPRILSNARRVLTPSSALLFALAFGEDADLALLRRLAAASGGTARRVPEEDEVAPQLAEFFREIENPLLRHVELSYPGATPRLVAPRLFPGYFQGSELVVAGRLEPGAERLRVHVAGHGGTGELRADTEVPPEIPEVPPGCPQHPPELLGGFVRRLWAHVTIRELLRARLSAEGTAARQKLAAEATQLALRHRFVTPLTALLVVTPGGDGGSTGPPPAATPGLGGTVGTPRVTVHGHLVGAPSWPQAPSRPRTFLDALTLSVGSAAVTVTLQQIHVTGGGPPISLPFSHPARLRRPPLTLLVGRGGRLHLFLGPHLRFGVLRHRYGRPGALQRDHLGFYIPDGAGLSPKSGGLLGKRCPPLPQKAPSPPFWGWRGGDKCVPSPPGRLRGVRLAFLGTPGTARLQRGEVGVTATLVAKKVPGGSGGARYGHCWLVPRPEVLELLGGPYEAFLAPPLV
uniref:Inter-alpha-trypsin inhibitor heavy chain family member 6 n=1 Tax=Anas zonorhyncha TaxID=75864 RepID=A0A8B9ZV90_9AVES